MTDNLFTVFHACLSQAPVTQPLSAHNLGTVVQNLEAAKVSLGSIVEAGKVKE